MKSNWLKAASVVLILFNSVGALAGGGGLILDPSGKGLQLSLDWLRYSPFNDFFIPGIILFLVNGLFGLVVLAMIFMKYEKYPVFVLIQAILLGGWIIIQMILLHTINFLHILYIFIAVALVVLGLVQINVRREKFAD